MILDPKVLSDTIRGGSFDKFYSDIKKQLDDLEEAKKKYTKDLSEAIAQGDLSENSEYKDAIENLAKTGSSQQRLSNTLKALATVDLTNYTPIGMVVMQSTVRLQNTFNGDEYCFMLFPAGVSDLEKQMLSIDSPIGKALWRKQVGETFAVDCRITGDRITWKVLDIY